MHLNPAQALGPALTFSPGGALGRRTRLAAILSLALLATSILALPARADDMEQWNELGVGWFGASIAGTSSGQLASVTTYDTKPLGVNVRHHRKTSYQWGTGFNDWTHLSWSISNWNVASNLNCPVSTCYSVVTDHKGEREGWGTTSTKYTQETIL